MPQVRILRVMEYVGELEAVTRHLAGRQVKGTRTFEQRRPHSGVADEITIREVIIGDYPEVLEL